MPPLALWDLAVSNLHVLTTMLSFTVVWQIPDLPCWYQLRPGLNLDIFLFPVTTLNNFLYLTTPRHSAVSIHQVDWPDTLGRIAPHPSPSCSHPMEVSWTSVTALTTQATNPLCQWPHLQQIFTQAVEEIHHPSSAVRQHTQVPLLPHPQFPQFCKSQLTSPSHNFVIPLLIVSTRKFRCNKTE